MWTGSKIEFVAASSLLIGRILAPNKPTNYSPSLYDDYVDKWFYHLSGKYGANNVSLQPRGGTIIAPSVRLGVTDDLFLSSVADAYGDDAVAARIPFKIFGGGQGISGESDIDLVVAGQKPAYIEVKGGRVLSPSEFGTQLAKLKFIATQDGVTAMLYYNPSLIEQEALSLAIKRLGAENVRPVPMHIP